MYQKSQKPIPRVFQNATRNEAQDYGRLRRAASATGGRARGDGRGRRAAIERFGGALGAAGADARLPAAVGLDRPLRRPPAAPAEAPGGPPPRGHGGGDAAGPRSGRLALPPACRLRQAAGRTRMELRQPQAAGTGAAGGAASGRRRRHEHGRNQGAPGGAAPGPCCGTPRGAAGSARVDALRGGKLFPKFVDEGNCKLPLFLVVRRQQNFND